MSSLAALFAERRLKCEKDQADKEKAQREERKAEQAAKIAKADARKQAMLRDPSSPKAIQARHATEVAQQMERDKRDREAVLLKIEGDKIARREREAEKLAKRLRSGQQQQQVVEKVAAAVDRSRRAEAAAWGEGYIYETPRSLRDFTSSASQSPTSHSDSALKQGSFPVIDIPDEVLRDVVLAKQCMRATDLDTLLYLKQRYVGMKELKDMQKEDVGDFCREGQKRGVIDLADGVVVESFASIFRETLTGVRMDWRYDAEAGV